MQTNSKQPAILAHHQKLSQGELQHGSREVTYWQDKAGPHIGLIIAKIGLLKKLKFVLKMRFRQIHADSVQDELLHAQVGVKIQ